MAPATCANALAHILDTPALAGEVVAVHPDAPGGKGFAVEPLVASAWLGNWRADSRCAVPCSFRAILPCSLHPLRST